MLRDQPILGWYLKIDALGSTKISADVAIAADVGRVSREYNAELTPSYVGASGVIMGKRDLSEPFKQNNPPALG
jgi:hypothetical protein